MSQRIRNIGITAIGAGLLGLARCKSALRGYATPDTLKKADVEGQIADLLNTFATLGRAFPPGWSPRGMDILELSPGSSRGSGPCFIDGILTGRLP